MLMPSLSVPSTSSYNESPLTDCFLRRVAAPLTSWATTFAERRRKGSTTPGSVNTLEARSIEGAMDSLGRLRFEITDCCLCVCIVSVGWEVELRWVYFLAQFFLLTICAFSARTNLCNYCIYPLWLNTDKVRRSCVLFFLSCFVSQT